MLETYPFLQQNLKLQNPSKEVSIMIHTIQVNHEHLTLPHSMYLEYRLHLWCQRKVEMSPFVPSRDVPPREVRGTYWSQ